MLATCSEKSFGATETKFVENNSAPPPAARTLTRKVRLLVAVLPKVFQPAR